MEDYFFYIQKVKATNTVSSLYFLCIVTLYKNRLPTAEVVRISGLVTSGRVQRV